MAFGALEESKIVTAIERVGRSFERAVGILDSVAATYAADVAKKPDLSKKNYTIVVNVDAKNEVERENGTSYSEPRLEKVVSAIENLDRPQDV